MWPIDRTDLQKLADSTSGYALLFGTISYVGLVWAYTRFYGVIGLAPDEVGVSYLDVLTRSALVLTVVALPIALVLLSPATRAVTTAAAIIFMLNLAVSLLWWQSDPVGWEPTRSWVAESARHINSTVNDSRDSLERGERIDPVRIGGLTLFGFRATPATLHWTKPAAAREMRTADDPTRLPCVLYLGSSDDSVVVFDPTHDQIIRASVLDTFVTLDSRPSCNEPLHRPSRPREAELIDQGGNRYVRANIRINEKDFRVLAPSPTLDELRRSVEELIREGAVHSFRQIDGSEVVIRFADAQTVEIRGLRPDEV